MNNFDNWINSIVKEVKREAEKEIGEEFKKVVVLYAEMFHEAVIREWDSYMDGYSPKMYERTGMTRAGIMVDSTPKIKIDGTIEASVEFIDAFMQNYDTLSGGTRHVFKSMNDGWGNKNLRQGDTGYRFRGFDGLHILESVEQEIKSQLPSYIKLEVKWSGDKLG